MSCPQGWSQRHPTDLDPSRRGPGDGPVQVVPGQAEADVGAGARQKSGDPQRFRAPPGKLLLFCEVNSTHHSWWFFFLIPKISTWTGSLKPFHERFNRNVSGQSWFRLTVDPARTRQYNHICYEQNSCTLNCPDNLTPAESISAITSSNITWHKVEDAAAPAIASLRSG